MKNIDEKQYEIYVQQYLDELNQKLKHFQEQFTDNIEHQL
ncbi:unnamed protein product, partial [Rotaria socialis]